jgi:5-amino-6-(5-phosphoribosylamino)uracil reductase
MSPAVRHPRGASKRPFVTANFALTWDCRISTRLGTASDFSSPRDKKRLLEIRARADAVLTSVKTVASDRMTMGMPDAALRQERVTRKQAPYPLRVLLSNTGAINPALPVFGKDFSPIVIFTTTRMPESRRSALAGKADLWMHDERSVNLRTMMTALRSDYGVKRLVYEGGGQVFRALLAAGLVDELHVTLCPRVFGGIRAPTLTGLAGDFLPKSVPLSLRKMDVVDGECFLLYRVGR